MNNSVASDPRVATLRELYYDTEPTMEDPIDELLRHSSSFPEEAYKAMWALIDECVFSSYLSRSPLSRHCRAAKYREKRGEPYGKDRILALHQEGNEAWTRACKRYDRTGLGFLPEHGGYDRLWQMREIFWLVEKESKSPKRSFSKRYHLAQGMKLMAELFEQVNINKIFAIT
jgi:hypothetical protein